MQCAATYALTSRSACGGTMLIRKLFDLRLDNVMCKPLCAERQSLCGEGADWQL